MNARPPYRPLLIVNLTVVVGTVFAVGASACATAHRATGQRTSAATCDYDVGFNDGLREARADRPMDTSAYGSECGSRHQVADARRGYREGYVAGLDGPRRSAPAPPVSVDHRSADREVSSRRLAAVEYEPWYTHPGGWAMVAAGLGLGIGAVIAHVEFDRKHDMVTCTNVDACPSFAARVGLADQAEESRTARDALAVVSALAITAGVITFIAWKRPVADAQGGGDDAAQLQVFPTSDGRHSLGLQGRLIF